MIGLFNRYIPQQSYVVWILYRPSLHVAKPIPYLDNVFDKTMYSCILERRDNLDIGVRLSIVLRL